MALAEEKPVVEEPGRSAPSTAAAFEQLRDLLLGREKSALTRLEARIENPALRAEDVGQVLPRAFSQCSGQEDRLATAMSPYVESALKSSVRRDPGVLANAIFPIIGPAIRKSIADTFTRLVQTFSHALENSLSARGLKWRLEAWRTGRPFAEVVLCHTLVFRVEQVLLVHRPSGLLVLQAAAPELGGANGDVISGMLSALQDFMRDSFNTTPGEHLQTVRVGELNLWVETGPHAILAAVIRGQAPAEFQTTLARALEAVHREESNALAAFTGDSAPFETLRPVLEGCLLTQTTSGRRPGVSLQAGMAVALVVLLALSWAFVGWRRHARREELLARLRHEPGLLITAAATTGGRFVVTGLRDPLAVDPGRLAEQSGWRGGEVEFRLQPFLALSPEMTLQRVANRISPPPGVEMALRDGVLILSGAAPEVWWREARAQALLVPGVDRLQSDRLLVGAQPGPAERLAALRQSCARLTIGFERGKSSTTDADAALEAASSLARSLHELARSAGARASLVITARTDPSGAEPFNATLRRQRAEWVRQKLLAAGAPDSVLQLDPATTPAPAPEPDAAGAANPRRVTFSVFWQHPPKEP